MKSKFLVRVWKDGGAPKGTDQLKPLGTLCMFLGVLAAAAQQDEMDSYLMATGLLFHLTAWFENWWRTARRA